MSPLHGWGQTAPSGDLLLKSTLIPAFRTNIQRDGLSKKAMSKVPKYFLNNPLQKITIPKCKHSDIADTPTLLCSVQWKVLEQCYFKYILLKYTPELSYLNQCEKLKLDLIMAIFRISHDWLVLFR